MFSGLSGSYILGTAALLLGEFDFLLLLMRKPQKEKDSRQQDTLLLENEGLEIPAELAALIKEIQDDLGFLPEAYVQAAAGQAGRGVQKKENDSSAEENRFATKDGYRKDGYRKDGCRYDEWDYRRAGYRKDWCTLTEKSLQPVRSGFVAGILGACPRISILFKVEAFRKNKHRHIVNIPSIIFPKQRRVWA